MQPGTTQPSSHSLDQNRDQQIRAFCELIKLYWQIEPEDTFSEVMTTVNWALEDPDGEYDHDDESVYKQLYALYKQRGGDGDVCIGPFIEEGAVGDG